MHLLKHRNAKTSFYFRNKLRRLVSEKQSAAARRRQNKKNTISVLAPEKDGHFSFLLLLCLLLLLLVALPSPLSAYLPDPSPAHAESQ